MLRTREDVVAAGRVWASLVILARISYLFRSIEAGARPCLPRCCALGSRSAETRIDSESGSALLMPCLRFQAELSRYARAAWELADNREETQTIWPGSGCPVAAPARPVSWLAAQSSLTAGWRCRDDCWDIARPGLPDSYVVEASDPGGTTIWLGDFDATELAPQRRAAMHRRDRARRVHADAHGARRRARRGAGRDARAPRRSAGAARSGPGRRAAWRCGRRCAPGRAATC